MDRLGHPSDRVLIGPRTGVDAAVIEVGDKCVVLAEDPIFPAAGLPLDTFGWFTMHIGASDVAVTGVKPEFATYTLLMPPGTSDRDFETIVDSIHVAAMELEIAIIGGHTGYYPLVNAPIVGGITVIGTCDRGRVISPAGACPGDVVLMTKGPAIEATALLAIIYEDRLRERYGDAVADTAIGRRKQITVVEDALTARSAAPVSAMHDATEGGVMGGLWEMAAAAGVGMEIDEAAMIWPDDVEAVCELVSIDPLASIAEGTLLLSVPEAGVDDVVAALAQKRIPCSPIGRVTDNPSRRVIRRRNGRECPLAVPREDPFWGAFFAGVGGTEGEEA
jgi:hydrogenase maturation factor